MFEGTLIKQRVSSFKHFIQIVQNFEFAHAKFLLHVITETFDSVIKPGLKTYKWRSNS
jgi:hypothetical protein